MKHLKAFIGYSLVSRIIVVLAALLLVLVIFWGGAAVGYRQAQFSCGWDSHYAEVFGGPESPFDVRPDQDDISVANGAAGQVIAIHFPVIAVKGPDQVEKAIVLGPKTVIRLGRHTATTSDIGLGDILVAIGSPDNSGRIIASFVRIMPVPSQNMASGTGNGNTNSNYQSIVR